MTHSYLERVTLTGVDDDTDLDRLVDLTAQYPFVEWGVLVSFNNMGNGRYPKLGTIDAVRARIGSKNLSLHWCGRSVHHFLRHGVNIGYGRNQLNFNLRKSQISVQDFFDRLKDGHTLITQHNKSNAEFTLMSQDHGYPNWHILWDASGGRGVGPADWQPPFAGSVNGYAGGIGPDNVVDTVVRLNQLNNQLYYIDMESSLRVEDKFNLDLCEQVLQKTSAYV